MAPPRKMIDLERLREVYAETGSLVTAAQALGISDRTLNRRRAEDPALDRILFEAKQEFRRNRRFVRQPHGTRARYVTCTAGPHGTKCDACRRANTAAAERNRRIRKRITPFEKIPHGLNGYRNYGCTCDVCSTAHSEAMRAYRRDTRRVA